MRTLILFATPLAALLAPSARVVAQSPAARYAALTTFFTEWRAFERPPSIPGAPGYVPDYRPATSARRLAALGAWDRRFAAIDTNGWTISQRVDWHLVRAEMHGLRYHLRVLKPFSRDPAYYASIRESESDTPAEEGPTIHSVLRLWQYPIWPRTALDSVQPLSAAQTDSLTRALVAIPPLLTQARANLAASNARDLWVGGVRAFEEQSALLHTLASRVPASQPALREATVAAHTATDTFAAWLRDEAPKKTGPSGIGTAQYTWYLRNVLLVPLTWNDEVAIVRRELARAHAALRLEEHRNRALPPMEAASSPDAYRALQERAIDRWMTFVRTRDVLSIEPWMERALRERMPGYTLPAARNFFAQTNHRDPVPLWTHLYHWWDNGRIRYTPHASPIRRSPLLYNVWMSRAEGMATAMEEWMMHAGLYDDAPRSREIVWIMLITRAARGLGNLFAHSNQLTMEGAGTIHVQWTPREWMRRDPLLGFEQHLYLRQPGYGTSYVTGGRLLEETMADRARQLGSAFTLKRFLDEVNGAGMIPVSMIHWELTGDDRMVRELGTPGPLPTRP